MHEFEAAGLGRAPFRFVNIEEKWFAPYPGGPKKPGSSCDYCFHAIAECCWVEDADGKRFKVGNECIKKVGDRGLYDPMKRELARLRTQKRNERADERIALAKERLSDQTTRDSLTAQPSPNKWRAEQGETALDWADWMMKNAGTTGRLQVAKRIGC